MTDGHLGVKSRKSELKRPVRLWAIAVLAVFVVSCTADEGVVHVVQQGEHLGRIAEQHCGSSGAVDSIFEQNRGRRLSNGQTFDDRNDIFPGQELVIDCRAAGGDAGSGEEPAVDIEQLREAVDPRTNPSARTGWLVAIGILGVLAIGLWVGSGQRSRGPAGGSPPSRPPRTSPAQTGQKQRRAPRLPMTPVQRSRPFQPSRMSPSHPNAPYIPGNLRYRPPFQSSLQKQMRNPMSPINPNARNIPGNQLYRRR